jgi:hypothetical protein
MIYLADINLPDPDLPDQDLAEGAALFNYDFKVLLKLNYSLGKPSNNIRWP